MLSRRDLVGRLATGSAAALALGIARTSSALPWNEARTPPTAEPTDHLIGREPNAQNGHQDGRVPEAHAQEVQPIGVPQVGEVGAAEMQGSPSPWQLLRPLALGSTVGYGWHVADLSPVMNGACVLTLQNQRGRSYRVHLCRNAGSPRGLVYTERLDLVVMNGGRGDVPTEEGLAQAVAQVAHVLAANEFEGQQPLLVALLSHAERMRLFAGPDDWRLR